MRCGEFLHKVRTGGPWTRLLARLHAARCGRCAALQNAVKKMEAELARTSSLADAQRRLWEQAMESPREHRSRSPVRLRLAAIVAVAALLGVTVVVWQWMGNPPDVQPVAQMGDRLPPDAPGLPALRQMDERRPAIQALEALDVQVVQHDPGFQVAPAQKARKPASIPLYQQIEDYHKHPEAQSRTLRELDEIRSVLDVLSAKLDELSCKARLLSARRQVTELIDRYADLRRK